jgi:hypothetical protein
VSCRWKSNWSQQVVAAFLMMLTVLSSAHSSDGAMGTVTAAPSGTPGKAKRATPLTLIVKA